MPDDLAIEYTRKTDIGQEWKVEDLVSFLQQEVESRECAAHLSNPREIKDAHAAQKQHYKPDLSREKWKRANVP